MSDRAARSRDDNLNSARFRARRILDHPVRRAMRGNDLGFVRNAEVFQGLGGMAHGVPIGLATHDDADQRLHAGLLSLLEHILGGADCDR